MARPPEPAKAGLGRHQASTGNPAAAKPTAPGPLSQPTFGFGEWMEAFPGIAIVLSEDGCIAYVNREVGGLDPKEAIGIDLLDLVPERERRVVRAAIQDALHPGLAHTLDLPLLQGDAKSWRWAHVGISPAGLAGNRRGVLISGLDITDRRHEEERLKQAEQLLVDNEGVTHIGTWYWDITRPDATWSPELYRIYGLDPAKHTPTYQDYLTRIHPDDVERVKTATEAVFKDRRAYSHDERIRHTDGTWRYLHTWARAVEDEKGNLVALVGICQDITDRKAAEAANLATQARFRALFERAAFGVAILDEDGVITEANPALRELGGRPDEELAGTPLCDLLAPDAAPACKAAVADLANGRSAGRQLEARLVRATGSPVETRLTIASVRSEGTAPFTVALVEDRSLASQALAADRLAFTRFQELEKVAEASEVRNQLLRIASHELKNPLTPVILQLHLLGRESLGPLNDGQRRAVAVATRQVDRITHLLEDVLEMARIEQGQLAVNLVRTDLAPVVRRVHEAFQPVAAEWHTRLEAAIEDSLWTDGDPARVEQVLFNLVGNALKFTPAGRKVEIHAGKSGDHILLSVKDEGPGMDEAQLSRLFKAFSQVHGPGTARQEGTGLGLLISKSIVEALGGTIAVTSTPGQGSVFTVTLPAAPSSGSSR